MGYGSSDNKYSFTSLDSSYYRTNGIAGTHYYYYTIGKIAFVLINMYCTTPSNDIWRLFATGAPKARYPNQTFSTSGQTNGATGPSIYIDENGHIFAAGGSAGTYYYATCVYEWTS